MINMLEYIEKQEHTIISNMINEHKKWLQDSSTGKQFVLMGAEFLPSGYVNLANFGNENVYVIKNNQICNFNFSNLDLRKIKLLNITFDNCKFYNSTLEGAVLSNVTFNNTDLSGVNLSRVVLSNVYAYNVNFRLIKLQGCDTLKELRLHSCQSIMIIDHPLYGALVGVDTVGEYYSSVTVYSNNAIVHKHWGDKCYSEQSTDIYETITTSIKGINNIVEDINGIKLKLDIVLNDVHKQQFLQLANEHGIESIVTDAIEAYLAGYCQWNTNTSSFPGMQYPMALLNMQQGKYVYGHNNKSIIKIDDNEILYASIQDYNPFNLDVYLDEKTFTKVFIDAMYKCDDLRFFYTYDCCLGDRPETDTYYILPTEAVKALEAHLKSLE